MAAPVALSCGGLLPYVEALASEVQRWAKAWRKLLVAGERQALLPLQDFAVLLFGFVCLQHFGFLFKLTSPHSGIFLLLYLLLHFPFP